MSNNQPDIIEKVMCILIDDQYRLLASKGQDKIKNETFFRLIGGSLNPGEDPEAGIRREIQEELNSELEDLRSLTTIDNKFVFNGQSMHQKVYLFRGSLSDKEIYKKTLVHIIEEPNKFDAEWIPVKDILEGRIILYPPFDYQKFLNE